MCTAVLWLLVAEVSPELYSFEFGCSLGTVLYHHTQDGDDTALIPHLLL